MQTTYLDHSIFFLPTDRKDGEPWNLYPHIPGYGANLPYLLEQYLRWEKAPNPTKTEYNRYYSRLYRKLQYLSEQNLISLWKGPGSLWWAKPTTKSLNLMQGMQNSNQCKTDNFGVWKFPRNARNERKEALRITLQSKMMDHGDLKNIQELFYDYLEDINSRVILLKHRNDEHNPDPQIVQLSYKTRFNDEGRKVEKLKEYEGIWDKTTKQFKQAVFLTLTTDPKRFKSVYHANRHFSVALNRYFSLLRKRVGYRIPYVAVYEFTKKGLLHVHIAFFGIRYLDHYKGISKDWKRCGQGQIVHIYAIKNDGGKWSWLRRKPKDGGKKSPVDYLKKYLKKGLYDSDGQEMYWTMNKRHFTNSRSLSSQAGRKPASGLFIFIGSCHVDQIPWEMQQHNERVWRVLKKIEWLERTEEG